MFCNQEPHLRLETLHNSALDGDKNFDGKAVLLKQDWTVFIHINAACLWLLFLLLSNELVVLQILGDVLLYITWNHTWLCWKHCITLIGKKEMLTRQISVCFVWS